MFRVVVLLCFLAALQLKLGSACLDSHGHANLDLERYKGTWNLYGFVEPEPFTGQKHRCVSESYYKRDDSPFLLDTMWNGTINGERVSESGIITLASLDPTDASNWDLYMDGARFDSHVLATDYDTWAVERTCATIPDPDQTGGGHTFQRLMIRSRGTFLSAQVLQTLLSFAESYRFDPRNFEMIDHANCNA